ncbi:MAG: 2'-5' RNA ligase family protein [Flavisolibacter sp.]
MPAMYFIALVLPDLINEKVLKYKNYMKEKYDCSVGLKSPAHITLVPPFWMEVEKENDLKKELQKFNRINSFELATNHFSAFKPRTIFIALAASSELEELKASVDGYFKDHTYFKFKLDSRPFHPHITIATRDLSKKNFQEAWPYFEKKEFLETWKAEGISVLRHNGKNWDVVHTTLFNDAYSKNHPTQ